MKPFSIDCIEPEQGPEGVAEVRVKGFLDAHTVVSFEDLMDGLLEKQYRRVIIDLSELNYISSAGIGTMMVLLQQLRRRDGDMVIMNPSAKVHKILDLLGFTKIFTIARDRDVALQALN